MSDEPQVWHYGLMAERWAEFINECREAPFFLKQIERYGQPVLDVACGTGLVPLLRAGTDEPATADHEQLVFIAEK